MTAEEKQTKGFPETQEMPETPDNGNVQAHDGSVEVEDGPQEPVEKSAAELLLEREEEIRVLQDRLLRFAAEMENTRKRLEREKSDGISYANESILRELLPVIDNLERALEHAENEVDRESLLEGVRMTLKAFLSAVAKFGCTPFEAMGKAFDPNYHEAFMQQESSEYPEKTVMKELQKGYVLNDRLLRPASVIISRGPGE